MFRFIEKISDIYNFCSKIETKVENISEAIKDTEEVRAECKSLLLAEISKKGNTMTKQEVIAMVNMIKTND